MTRMMKPRRTIREQTLGFDRQNLESARIILADIERNGGKDSLAVRWALAVVQRLTVERQREAGIR